MARALTHFNGKQSLRSLSGQVPSLPSSSHRPTIVTMARGGASLASIDADVEAHLRQAIPVRPPLSVFEPMHHLTFAAPRIPAPALCIASCELVGGHRDEAMAAAAALHLMHAAAYAHENLPLTDRPRTKPAIHHAFNPNIELLTGDGIFPFGYELLARSVDPTKNNTDRVLRVIVEVTRAMGSQGVVDGQYQEMKLFQSDGGGWSHADWVGQVCRKKDGELHACAAACGAILGGGSEEEIEGLRRYGRYVGMLHGARRVGKGSKELMQGLRELGRKELEIFKDRNVESISSFC